MSPPPQQRVQHNKETAEATVVLQFLQQIHFYAEGGLLALMWLQVRPL